MTLNDIKRRLKEKGKKPLTEKEVVILERMFNNFQRVDTIIFSSYDKIIAATQKEPNCFILHENSSVNKFPPNYGETFFGIYIQNSTETRYIIARP